MKMSRFEKFFVNSASHSRRVATQAARRLRFVPVQPGQTYLDVGCGNGAAALRVANEYNLNVMGIDIDPKQTQLAQQAAKGQRGIRFFVGDATCLPFDDGEFDVVATQKTTHHIPNWEAALAEMLRVLKPGGYFLYSDLIAPAWLASLTLYISSGRYRFPTRTRLNHFVEESNLGVIRRATCGLSYEAVLHRQ